MPAVFKSRAFWVALVDALPLILNLILGKFWPSQQEFVYQLWGAFQPVAIVIIGYYAVSEAGKSETLRQLIRPDRNR